MSSPPSPSISISISEASHSDVPTLISICTAALEPDILQRFLYSPNQAIAIQKQTESLTASLGARFTNPTNRCYIHKAVDQASGEIVGWSLVRWEDGSWTGKESVARDDDFVGCYGRHVRLNWRALLGVDKLHVVLGALYVRPDYQGKGVGTQLINFLYSSYGLEKDLVIVQTRAMSESFYQRLGWVTADSTDVDLSKWGGQGRGYGIHRSPQMLRHPSS